MELYKIFDVRLWPFKVHFSPCWIYDNQPASDRQKPYNERALQKNIKLTISINVIELIH